MGGTTPSFGVEDLARYDEELAEHHRIPVAGIRQIRARLNALDLKTQGAVAVPDLDEALGSGVEPDRVVRWLSEADLEAEGRALTTWLDATEDGVPAITIEELPALLSAAAGIHATQRDALVSRGACEGPETWLARQLCVLYPAWGIALAASPGPVGADLHDPRLPADEWLLPELRAAVHALREAMLASVAIALGPAGPRGFWEDVLARLAPDVTPSMLALAGRTDDLFGQIPDCNPCGGLGDTVRLAAHLECEAALYPWSDVAHEIAALGADPNYYALRLGPGAPALRAMLDRARPWIAMSRRYVGTRVEQMREALRAVAARKEGRLLDAIARRRAPQSRLALLGKWDVPGKREKAARPVSAAPQEPPIVIHLTDGNYFAVGRHTLTYPKGPGTYEQQGITPQGPQGRWLRDIVTGSRRMRKTRSTGSALSQLRRSLRNVPREPGRREIVVDAQLIATPALVFDDATRTRLGLDKKA